MPQDLYQIGPWLVSKSVIDIISPLIGTIIGGLITYISVRASDRHKLAQEKSDQFQEQYREVIALALDWIDPHRDAIETAKFTLMGYFFGRIDEESYLKRWPELIGHPLLKDPPKRLRILLPEDIYPRFNGIRISLMDIKSTPLMGIRGTKDFEDNYELSKNAIQQLINEIDKLEEYLIEEYKKTYR